MSAGFDICFSYHGREAGLSTPLRSVRDDRFIYLVELSNVALAFAFAPTDLNLSSFDHFALSSRSLSLCHLGYSLLCHLDRSAAEWRDLLLLTIEKLRGIFYPSGAHDLQPHEIC